MDSNLDLLKSSSHSHTQLFLENNIIKNVYLCISILTHVTHNTAMLIDNIWCSEKLHRDNCSHVIVEDISDHYPCITLLPELKNIVKIEKSIFIQPIKDQNIKELRHELATENWEETLNSLTCNEGFEKFHKFLVDTIHKLCPEKQIKVKGKRKRYDPWITKGIQHSISKQKQLYRESINHVATGKTNEYKAYKAKLQSIIRKSKQSYLRSKCTEYQRNAKKMW